MGFLVLVPGIILGYSISRTMERIGLDFAIRAGRVASNIMWLGVGTGIFIAANILLVFILGSSNEFDF